MIARWTGALSFCMVLAACGGHPAPGPSSPTGEAEAKANRGARADKAQGDAKSAELKVGVDNINEVVTKRNDGVETKLNEALGIAGGAAGKPSVASMIAELRQAKVKTTVTAPADFQQGFFVPDPKALSDAAKEKKGALDKKIVPLFTDFSTSVSTISFLSFTANENALTMHLQTLQVAAAIKGNQKKFSRATTPEDLGLLQKIIVQERRAELLSGAATALAAATSAAINSPKSPKGLDDVVKELKTAMPPKGEATEEDAKVYLAGLDGGLGDARTRYEGWLQQSYGPTYARSTMKSIVDQVFKQAEQDLGQTSQADARKARDERKAQKNAAAGSGGGATPGGVALPSGSGSVADTALAMGKGLLPADSPIRKGLDTFDALRNGDTKGALNSAMVFVPNGPVKSALGLALKFW